MYKCHPEMVPRDVQPIIGGISSESVRSFARDDRAGPVHRSNQKGGLLSTLNSVHSIPKYMPFCSVVTRLNVFAGVESVPWHSLRGPQNFSDDDEDPPIQQFAPPSVLTHITGPSSRLGKGGSENVCTFIRVIWCNIKSINTKYAHNHFCSPEVIFGKNAVKQMLDTLKRLEVFIIG